MNLVNQPVNGTVSFLLGRRRSTLDPARRTDWDSSSIKEDLEAAARSRAYPSPPMSGSPPLPQKAAQETSSYGEASGIYAASRPPLGFHPTAPQHQSVALRGLPPSAQPMPRSYAQEAPAGTAYSYPRVDEPARLSPYSLQPPHVPPGLQHQPYMPAGGPSPTEDPPQSHRQQGAESQPYTSPKSQRKTKGHVASACVPCKRAHLRCDAQRPCSRCIGNSKEESCIDVQHKKRGRPRLRDERDARFDPARYPHPQDTGSRRPLNIYPSGSSGQGSYEDPLRRSQSYRSLESRPGEQAMHGYFDRPTASDTNFYNPSILAPLRPLEPLAYLNMDLEIIRASPSFTELIGIANVAGRKLRDLVAHPYFTLIHTMQSHLINEQRSREPNYLPPILGGMEQVIQDMGFSAEDGAQFRLDRQESLVFVGTDGYTRMLQLRYGLVKQGSFYFVVILLLPPPRQHHLSPALDAGESQPSYNQPTSLHLYTDHAASSSSFDLRRHRTIDGSLRSPSHQQGTSSGISPGSSVYSPHLNRPEYPASSAYHLPRSDGPPTNRTPTPHTFQLPPIRAHSEQGGNSREFGAFREERSSRVDIGGLLDRSDSPERRR